MRLEILEERKAEDIAYGCTQCGFCNANCPTGNELRWELGSPRGKIFFTRWLKEHGRNIPGEFVERIFECTMCGRCSTECQADLNTTSLWEAIRGEIGRRGLWPPGIKRLVSSIRRSKNIYGLPQEERLLWADEFRDKIAPKINRPAKVAYFVGCVSSFSGRAASIAQAMFNILEAAKISYTVLGTEEWCSGTPLHFSGERETSIQLAEHNAAKFEGLGVDTVVTPCAGCYRALKKVYPEIVGPMSFKVQHSSEFIFQLIKEGKLKPGPQTEKKLAYHDPCLLGRHCNVYQPPRDVLQKLPGLKIQEFLTSCDKARCSGGGGNMRATYPDLTIDVGERLIHESKQLGVEMIATACPTAKLTLMDAIERSKAQVQTADLVEVVAKSLETQTTPTVPSSTATRPAQPP